MSKAKKPIQQDNFIIQTLSFLNQKIDNIVGKSDLINELLQETDDPMLIQKLNDKLQILENEIDYIGKKIELEHKNLKKS